MESIELGTAEIDIPTAEIYCWRLLTEKSGSGWETVILSWIAMVTETAEAAEFETKP